MRSLLLPTAIALVVGFGIWEGLWTDRWSLSQEAEGAAGKLTSVPMTIGDWIGQDQELDARQVARAEMSGYVLRQFTNRVSRATVQVLLVCGRAGPMSLHSPDVCYQGVGYSMPNPPEQLAVKGPSLDVPANFWVARFLKSGPTPEPLRIYWSWSATGAWTAPANPRWDFGGNAFLYKLYVIRALPKLDEPMAEDPTADFLRLFLPELGKSLFPKAPLQRAVGSRRSVPAAFLGGRWS